MKRTRKNVANGVRKKAVEGLYSKCLYISSGTLARRVEKLAIDIWKPAGLPPSHAYLLQQILSGDICFPSRVAQDLMLSPSTVTRLLDKLERMNLISRTPYEHLICVQPTQKARDLEPLLLQCEWAFDRECRAIFGEAGSDRLNLLLNTATDKLAEAR